MMARMDRSAAWRSALLMGAAVALIAVILGVTAPRAVAHER